MSVIQKIRDKYARIAVIAIALALLGFIAMDAFTGRSNPFGSSGPSSNVGSVNGTNIKYEKYNDFVTQIEDNYKAQGQNLPAYLVRPRAMQQAWEMMVSRVLLEDEFEKLGITVSDKEITNTIIYNPELEQQVKQSFPEFVNQQTGVLDLQNLVQQINASRKGSSSEQKKLISDRFEQLILSRMNEKYGSLIINGSANVPKWMIEKQAADESQIAKIAYVKKLYSSVSDSLVKVTDQEIQNYIDKHKADFKQVESRSIAYVTFPVIPSAKDSSDIVEQVQKLKDSFATTNDPVIYVESNSTAAAEIPSLTPAARLSPTVKDTLTKVPVNGVFGPYVDGNTVTLARLMEKKDLPDSAKCRHIIIGVPQGASDSAAKVLIDSIEKAIIGGASWEEMAKKYNSDGTRNTKGEMTFTYDQMTDPNNFAPEFAQFILFDGKPGQSKKLKTSFGWHYVNIMDWMAVQPYYKFAYLRNPISASATTIQEARNNANTFAGEARDEKSFNEQIDKVWRAKGFDKNIATDITPIASSVSSLMDARGLVKRVYEAKRGEVLQPEEVGNDFVVAVVTGIYEEGTQSPATARPVVEDALRNTKKGELIAKELGAVTTLEAAATKWNSAIEVADSVSFVGGQLSFEPKVVGAAFNPGNRNKIVPSVLAGSRGVYVVRVDNVTAVPNTGGAVAERRKQAIESAKRSGGNPLEGLFNAAKIKDKRSAHF